MPRFAKYFLVSIGIILAILIAIPFVVPIEKYTDLIKAEVKKATGRDLSINGKINLTLLPRPSLIIKDVKLSSLPRAQVPDMIALKEAKLVISVLPLLTGNISVARAELNHPVVNLEKFKDGTANWELTKLPPEAAHGQSLIEGSEEKGRDKFELPLVIEHLIINQGKLQYLEAGNKTEIKIEDLDIYMQDKAGPVSFAVNSRASDPALIIKGEIKKLEELMPLTASVSNKVGKVTIAGNLDTIKSSFKGTLELSSDLRKIAINNLPHGLQEELKATAELYADQQKATLDSLQFNIGTVKARGEGSYDIVHEAGQVNLVLQPGEIEAKLSSAKNPTGNYEGKLNIHALKISTLLDALKVETKGLTDLLNQDLRISAVAGYTAQGVSVKDIMFSAGKTVINGSVGFKKSNNDSSYAYNLRTNNGSDVIKFIGLNSTMALSEVSLKGTTTISETNIKTDTMISVAKSDTRIEGDVNLSEKMISSLVVSSSGNDLAYTLSQIAGAIVPGSIRNFSLSSSIKGNYSQKLEAMLNNFKVVVGGEEVSIKGDSLIFFNKVKPMVSLNLEVTKINIDNLSEGLKDNTYRAKNDGTSPARSIARKDSNPRWSHEKIDFGALQSFDGNLNLIAGKVTKGQLVFNNLRIKADIKDGELELTSLTGNVYGGELKGNGFLSSKGNQPINFKVDLNGAQLSNIAPHNNQFKVTQGQFNLNADIKSNGKSQNQYIESLAGTIRFNGANGRFSGFDLQKVLNALNQAKNLRDVLGVINFAFSDGETEFKKLEGAVIIDKGVAEINKFELDAAGAKANATGNVNLPKYTLDINTNCEVDIKNMPGFGVKFYGALDNPQRKLDTGKLEQHLVKNVLGNVIDNLSKGGKPSDIFKVILGGGGSSAAKPSQPNSPADAENNNSNDPNKAINDLVNQGIQQLFKRK